MAAELQRYRPRYQSPDALVQRTSFQRWYNQASDPPSQSTSRGSSPDVSAVLAQSDVEIGPSYQTTPLRQTGAGMKAQPTPGPITTPEWIQSFQRDARLAVTPLRALGAQPATVSRTPQTTPLRGAETSPPTNSGIVAEKRGTTPLASLDRRRTRHTAKRPMFGTDFEDLARRRQALYLAEEETQLRALANNGKASYPPLSTGARNVVADSSSRSGGSGSAGAAAERKVKSFVEVLKEKRARELANRKVSVSTASAATTKTDVSGSAAGTPIIATSSAAVMAQLSREQSSGRCTASQSTPQRPLEEIASDVGLHRAHGAPESVLAQYLKVVSRATSSESCNGSEDKGNTSGDQPDTLDPEKEKSIRPAETSDFAVPLLLGSPVRSPREVSDGTVSSRLMAEERRDEDALIECETLLQAYMVPLAQADCAAESRAAETCAERVVEFPAEQPRAGDVAAPPQADKTTVSEERRAAPLSKNDLLDDAEALLGELEEFARSKLRHAHFGAGNTQGAGVKARKNTHEQQVDDVVHAFGHWFTASCKTVSTDRLEDHQQRRQPDDHGRSEEKKPLDSSVLAISTAFLASPNVCTSPADMQSHIIEEQIVLRDDVVNAILRSLIGDTVADLVDVALC